MAAFHLKPAYKDFGNIYEMGRNTNFEKHGIQIDYSDFLKLPKAEYADFQSRFGTYPLVYPHPRDFKPLKESALIDSGCILPNINDHFHGKAPDIGAYELGEENPVYGPRTKN